MDDSWRDEAEDRILAIPKFSFLSAWLQLAFS
jgi:hypothetical protein